MNRGAARQTIFRVDADRKLFLELVADKRELFGVNVHAYCLMGNHFHLLVECPDGGLSKFMHGITSPYVRHFNRSVGRDGPLLRSRFRSLNVETDSYVMAAARYIHRNPMDLGYSPAHLDRYRWSSFAHYLGKAAPPVWLTTAALMAYHGNSTELRRFTANVDQPSEDPVHWAWSIREAITQVGGVGENSRRVEVQIAFGLLVFSPATSEQLRLLLGDRNSYALERGRARARQAFATDQLYMNRVLRAAEIGRGKSRFAHAA